MPGKQITATWYTPEEKLPPEFNSVVVSISGRIGNTGYDHAIEIAEWADDSIGWLIRGMLDNEDYDITVHAWCDIDPCGWHKEDNHDSTGNQGRIS